MHTEIVSAFTVGAIGLAWCVSPKGGVVCISLARLEPKQPFVPCEASKAEGAPGGGMKRVVRV